MTTAVKPGTEAPAPRNRRRKARAIAAALVLCAAIFWHQEIPAALIAMAVLVAVLAAAIFAVLAILTRRARKRQALRRQGGSR